MKGKAVIEKQFEKFLSGLKEIEGTWYCGQMVNGGATGYDAKDKGGNIYSCNTLSQEQECKKIITKKLK